jgi:Phage-related protein
MNNRIFFFYWKGEKFVLLHHYEKKTNKTPPREIERAQNEEKDFLLRYDK